MSDDILNHVAGILSNASNNNDDNGDNTHAQPQLSMDDIVNAVADYTYAQEQFCVYGGPTMVDPVPGEHDINTPDPLENGLTNPYEDSDIYGGPTMPDNCTGDDIADGADGL